MASEAPESFPSLSIHQSKLYLVFLPYLMIPVLIAALAIILAILILKQKLYCSCEVCHSYVTMRWSSQFVNLCDWYTHLLRKSPTKTIHIHTLGNIITANPKNVEYILKTRFDNYPKGKPFSSILGDLLGKGIFNVDGDEWMFQKKMASHQLSRVSLRSFWFDVINNEIEQRLFPLFSSVAGELEKGVLDLQDVFRSFSFNSMCQFSFGIDSMCLESIQSNIFAASFDLATRLSAERALSVSPLIWKAKRFLNIGSEKRLHDAVKVINSTAQEIINQKQRLGLLRKQDDLLSHFMDVVQDETYLRDIVVSFILAGRDSVASALTSFFLLLANNPDVEEAIQREADRVLGKDQHMILSLVQMKDLHYFQASIYESMRLFPPIQFDSKFSLQDDVLPDGTFVSKGTRVTYHPYAMGRMEEIWGYDCLEFKPERWLKDGSFHQENPFKYPVFQAGPRVCLGMEMAVMEIKIVAFRLLLHYNIKLASNCSSVPKFSPGLSATFHGGLPVVVTEKISMNHL